MLRPSNKRSEQEFRTRGITRIRLASIKIRSTIIRVRLAILSLTIRHWYLKKDNFKYNLKT